jgi:hypothetical protein
MLATGLHAQTSSILIKSGDTINGISSNSATLRSLGSVVMNDLGNIAFQGYATESSKTNFVTNAVTRTNVTQSFQYTNAYTTNSIVRFNGTVTNVISRTNFLNVNGTTNAYVDRVAQIKFLTNQIGTNNTLNSFTNTYIVAQGGRLTTNTSVISTNIISTNTSGLSYSGIWSSDSNNVSSLLIRSGQPSGISNSTINYFYNPVVNNNGAVAFIGYSLVTNSVLRTNGTTANALSNVMSIYVAIPGSTNPIRVASVGSPAPGLSNNFTSFGTIALPDVGGVIFQAWAGTNYGVWAQNPDTSLQLIARRGQTIAVGGTNKVINSFNVQGRFHSQDTGAITYQAYFSDGTSAVVRVNR